MGEQLRVLGVVEVGGIVDDTDEVEDLSDNHPVRDVADVVGV